MRVEARGEKGEAFNAASLHRFEKRRLPNTGLECIRLVTCVSCGRATLLQFESTNFMTARKSESF